MSHANLKWAHHQSSCILVVLSNDINNTCIIFYSLGTIGLQQLNSDNEAGHIRDTVKIISRALISLKQDDQEISEAPKGCNAAAKSFESGPTILK